ncbi:MAG: signal peptide peptidase SppA [Burkholderiaceae bacterium]|nr:signal peptide peptidase SppA [Burkholderiaceae bacterium]
MASTQPSALRRFFGFIWRLIDGTRRAVLNLIFLLILVILVIGLASGGKRIEDKTVLILDLKGSLVEQATGNAREALASQFQGDEVKQDVQLRDILQVIDAAGKDPKISSIVLLMDDFEGAGLPLLREVADAIERFKATGKRVVAWGSGYSQRQYFIAAHANEVLLHPMGTVEIEGFGGHRNYYHDALDKLGVTVNLMRVGTYKSFAEPYIANEPSDAAAEAEKYLLDGMWKDYTDAVEKARKLPEGSIKNLVDNLPQLITAAHGDLAKVALDGKFVDGLATRDELRQMMLSRGVLDEKIHSFRQINYEDYLAHQKPQLTGDAVAVIVASGEISDGVAGPGSIGGLSTATMIRTAREDERVKAIVLRVDSPGGSAFGAELIRRELEVTKKAGKPVVISMGDVAASGGYWVSTSADEVIADPATITGSIGVFAILPTADKAMDKLGVHSGGYTTTWLRDGYNPLRPLEPRLRDVIQASVEHIYADFTGKVAAARKTTPEKIDEVAQGRVWTGQQAKERNLVDTLGSFEDAIHSAAKRAKLGDNYRVAYVERELSGFDKLVHLFDARVAAAISTQTDATLAHATGVPPAVTHDLTKDLGWLTDVAQERKPFSAITHCFCGQP